MENIEITGIVLSGGRSKRMGYNKAFARLNGRTLIGRAIEKLSPVVDRIVISANTNEYDHLGFRVIKDIIKPIGPAGGLLSCFKQIKAHHFFVLSCDMPFIPTALISFLIGNREDADICLPAFNGFVQPLCGYYSKNASAVFQSGIDQGIYKMMNIISESKSSIIDLENIPRFNKEYLFNNINSQDDLEAAQKLLKKIK